MKVSSPISASPFRKPMRRLLPLYLVLALAVLLFTQMETLSNNISVRGIFSFRSSPPLAAKIPKKIWQSWKVDPLEFEDRDLDRARSWTQLNPKHRYEVLTDANDVEYVEAMFGPHGVVNRPDIVYTYKTLQATIIKADLLRYLVMYVEGGVYADIDVSAIRGVDTWIPSNYSEADVGLIIGIEIDEPNFLNHTILGPKSRSFCQWTFACKPRQPVMMRLIEHVIHWLNEVAQNQHVPISKIALNFDEVITGTGPSAFTNVIMNEMTAQTGKRPGWENFHGIQEPIMVGNILVMTVEAFAAGQGHSNSGNHDSPKALIKHHYHASLWPSRHPRYSHPAFGMVEECNWKPECVEAWTYNTTTYDSLPEEHKHKLIAEKEIIDKTRWEKEEEERIKREKEEGDKRDLEFRKTCEAGSFVHSSHCMTDEVCKTVTDAFKKQEPDENGVVTVVVQGDTKKKDSKKEDKKEEKKASIKETIKSWTGGNLIDGNQ